MSEQIQIDFMGVDQVSGIISDLQSAIDDLNSSITSEGDDDLATDAEITIATDLVEPALEQVMWDILELIQKRAIENEAEFLLNSQ